MNLIQYMSAMGGSAVPVLHISGQAVGPIGVSSQAGIAFDPDGMVYENKNGSWTPIDPNNWITPHWAGGAGGDYSIYFLTVGMDLGSAEGIWLELGTVSRNWTNASSGLTRNTTIYLSYGDRWNDTDPTILGAWDLNAAYSFEVP